jgi:membrane-associated phospholipid phosphatase
VIQRSLAKRAFVWVTLVCSMLVTTTGHADEPVAGAGDVLQWLIPGAAFGATLGLRDWEGSEEFLWSAGTSLGITYALKYTIDERRPNGGHHSFPSGHTSSAFQGATFVQRRYGWEYGIPAYLGAAYTGWSRVELEAHHPHDVFAGAAVGILSSYLFTTPYRKDVEVGLFADGETVGFQMSFKW